METQLKQRLVGIAVIFSLAIIFLPMLLDGSGQNTEKFDITIPPQPQIENGIKVEEKIIELRREADKLPTLTSAIVDEINDPPEQNESERVAVNDQPTEKVKSESSEKSPSPVATDPQASEKIASKPEEKPTTPVQIGGDSWVIQVGSFKDKSKAYKERDRLRQSKLSAVFIERFEIKGIPSYRVRMGPFITRQKAKVVSNKVLAKYNIKGLIMKYEK
ncbi:MAG: SPOR domain-containing protein [Gammaproteobacteria bacterium]|nr:SPOR domain-containing protein [Gammaproteobacteria bacterium]